MIWTYFPIGMLFPVTDYSEKTKAYCWNIALSALRAGGEWADTELMESCREHIPGGAEKEYVCILYQKKVTQTRINCTTWENMSRLQAELSLHSPFYQANALQNIDSYEAFGTIDRNGLISATEYGKAFLPDRLPEPMQGSAKRNLLIAMDACLSSYGFSAALRAAGKVFAEKDWTVKYAPLADGGIGTTYALTYAGRGRFEWLKTLNCAGGATELLLGILPGSIAVFDAVALSVENKVCSSEALGITIQKILDLGYRRLLLPLADWQDKDNGEGLKNALLSSDGNKLDSRLEECEITVLTGDHQTCGTLHALQSLGARIENGPNYVFNKLHLFDRCRHTGRVIACGKNEGVIRKITSACTDHTPLLRLPDVCMAHPETIADMLSK